MHEGRLAYWRIAKPQLKRGVHLVHPTDRPKTHAVTVIEDLCREMLIDLAKTGEWSGASPIA